MQPWLAPSLGRLGQVQASRPIRVVEPDALPERSILDLLGFDAGGPQRTALLPGGTGLGQAIEQQLDQLERGALSLGIRLDAGIGSFSTDAVGRAVRQIFQEVDAIGASGLFGPGQPQASLDGADPAERPEMARILAAADDQLDAPMLPAELLTLAAAPDAAVTATW